MLAHLLLIALVVWPAATTDDATLRIKTDVADVEVFLDGKSVAKAPLTLTPVAVGAHHLALTKPGYVDHEEEVQVQAGATAKMFVIMKALPAEPPKLPAQFYAIHQHAAGGACSGMLTVTAEAIDYRSHDGHDVFHIPIQQIHSLSRSMGTAWWTSGPLKTPSQYSACRLEVPGKSYGFFAYEEDPKLAGTPAENRVTKEDTTAKTKEIFELIYRLWAESLEQRQHPKQAAN
jgi:hypothetical protein